MSMLSKSGISKSKLSKGGSTAGADARESIGDGVGSAGSTDMQDDTSRNAESESGKAGSSDDTSGISESEWSTDGSNGSDFNQRNSGESTSM